MKKLHLLSGMIVLGAIASINASPVKNPGGLTAEQHQKIQNVQYGKISRQQELARPAVYKMIDPLVEARNWPAIFSMLDQMQGVISVNEYRTDFDASPLLVEAVIDQNFLAAKKLLEKYHANPNLTIGKLNNAGYSPLMFACSLGDLAMVKLLLQHKADLNLATEWGQTAFTMAESYPEVLELLNQYKK